MIYRVERYKRSRNWAVYGPDGSLVCIAVYKKGAENVAAMLSAMGRS